MHEFTRQRKNTPTYGMTEVGRGVCGLTLANRCLVAQDSADCVQRVGKKVSLSVHTALYPTIL
eukprot:3233057-Prorocentrum_lima.AAC.1